MIPNPKVSYLTPRVLSQYYNRDPLSFLPLPSLRPGIYSGTPDDPPPVTQLPDCLEPPHKVVGGDTSSCLGNTRLDFHSPKPFRGHDST